MKPWLLPLMLATATLCACAPVGASPKNRGTESTTMTNETRCSKSGHDITPLTPARIEELAASLTPEERAVILAKGTERPFCGNLLDNKLEGVYACRLCGLPLFASNAKFNSGTGWPSFFQPVERAHVTETPDRSHGTVRTEITCARCGGHLGHVFDDGPRPTGLRFCLNSASLTFFENGTVLPPQSRPSDACR